jgi:hypothetical protein
MARGVLAAMAMGLAWVVISTAGAQPTGVALPAVESAFVRQHWKRPIPPQGPPPAHFSPVERALDPPSCGTCHPAQYADWRTSLHARAMGPGIAGQLGEMARSDPESARTCPECHAPLAEQSPEVPGRKGHQPNPAFDPGLRAQGVVCAACHVRRHQRFGPPRRAGAPAARTDGDRLPHDGATRTPAYLRSEFCSTCHQFGPEGFALNGKLLENSYEEWRRSPAARRGLQCQDCHMPDRRHLWRGIHDPDMVRSGLTITAGLERPRYRPGEVARARLAIASTGVGHHFPTYVTPRVVVRGELVDGAGRQVAGSSVERVIAREITLDLSREVMDTRIPAGGRFVLEYRHRVERPGLAVRFTVTVFPDHFYTGFFEALLAGGAGVGEAQIREALAATRRSVFELYRREFALEPPAGRTTP